MDIALIEPSTGFITNVISADSVAAAQAMFPGLACVERKANEMHEPGATLVGVTLTRASAVSQATKNAAKTALAANPQLAKAGGVI